MSKLRVTSDARNPGDLLGTKRFNLPLVETAPKSHLYKQELPSFSSAKISFNWPNCSLCYGISVVTIYHHLRPCMNGIDLGNMESCI